MQKLASLSCEKELYVRPVTTKNLTIWFWEIGFSQNFYVMGVVDEDFPDAKVFFSLTKGKSIHLLSLSVNKKATPSGSFFIIDNLCLFN